MAQHNEIGHWGENIACETLISKGYAIRERNFHIGHYELDIIATKGKRIVFIEVKTRTNPDFDPLDSINSKKISRITKAANAYIITFDIPNEPQFDIISITGTSDDYSIKHIEDAFRAPLSTK